MNLIATTFNNTVNIIDPIGLNAVAEAACILCACGTNAKKIGDAKKHVNERSAKVFPDKLPKDYDHHFAAERNAWRHCMVSCETHKRAPKCAEKALQCHEKHGTTFTDDFDHDVQDHQSDVYNNEIGKTLASNVGSCEENCNKAVDDGDLALFDDNYGTPDGNPWAPPSSLPDWWTRQRRQSERSRLYPEGPFFPGWTPPTFFPAF